MPVKKGVTVDNNFVGGRITQATGLNFPENACFDEVNCIFNERGFATRRPSFDFETNTFPTTITRDGFAMSQYVWKNASDDSAATLVVNQVGNILYFYLADSTVGLSTGILAGTIDLTAFYPAGGTSCEVYECSYASGLGKLFVTNPRINSFQVSYNATTHALTTAAINIQIRDTTGIVDTVTSVTQRPVALTAAHHYNLFNQGWDDAKITTFNTAATAYPSNADVWWIFKDASSVYAPGTTLASNTKGNAQSPRGSLVLDAFNQDRATITGIGGLAVVSTSGIRPSAVAFHAGRVFYSGVNAQGFSDKIYFTQIIERDEQLGQCYQAADPTSEDIFETVASDGGVARIPGAGQIFKLISLGDSLIVFAAHGVWVLTGSVGIGFTATDYTRKFLSSIKTLSATSFVDVEGFPTWWNIDGVYLIKTDQQGNLLVQSGTDKSIKDFFLSIPVLSKKYARGAYNTFTHVIQWLYRDATSTTFNEAYEFNKVLNFNTLSGAFYVWDIPATTVKTHGIVVTETGGSSLVNIYTVDNAALTSDAIDSSGNTIVVYGLGPSGNIHTTSKFLVSYNGTPTNKFTWAECANFRGDYIDWKTVDNVGVDYNSDFTTGFRVRSEGQRRVQVPYIFVFSGNDETTEYQFQTIWDYANSGDESRWSQTQSIVHSEENAFYVRRRLRVRGHGTALQFKFSSISGKPFYIIGWSTIEEASSNA